MLPVQLGGLKGCVGRIRQVRNGGDWRKTRPVRVSHVRTAATTLNGRIQNERRTGTDNKASCGVGSKRVGR